MSRYIMKRLVLILTALILIAIVVYFLMGLTNRSPINPTDYNDVKEYEKAYNSAGLNKPIIERFGKWVSGAFSGDFGKIYGQSGTNSIPDLFFGPIKYTIFITLPTFFLSAILGITFGTIAGYKRGTIVDTIINIVVTTFIGIPSFIIAAFALIIAPALNLPIRFILPEDGGYGLSAQSLILPILVMVIGSLAGYTYLVRNMVITVLTSNYVLIARAKGLGEWNIFKKYVLRNISIPVVTRLIPSYLILLSGSLVIEQIFQIPGSSTVIVNAVSPAEINIVMFNTMFFSLLGLSTTLIVDILYVIIDPRIKYEPPTQKSLVNRYKYWKIRQHNLKIQTLTAKEQHG